MQKIIQWMMAAILICGTTTASFLLTSCKKANVQDDTPASPSVVVMRR